MLQNDPVQFVLKVVKQTPFDLIELTVYFNTIEKQLAAWNKQLDHKTPKHCIAKCQKLLAETEQLIEKIAIFKPKIHR